MLFVVIQVYPNKFIVVRLSRFNLIQRKTSQLEALRSKLQREVIDRFAFYSIFASLIIFDRYCKMYEEKRRHWALIGKTPEPLWNYKTIAVNGFIR